MPRKPQANEALCPECDGIGFSAPVAEESDATKSYVPGKCGGCAGEGVVKIEGVAKRRTPFRRRA